VSADGPDEGAPRRIDDVTSVLLTRRVILVSGDVDAARASELGATLMTLDATGDGRIELRLSSCRGHLDAALALIDVVQVLGVPVHGSALGTIEGGPVGLLAACAYRWIAPHAVLRLREPDVEMAGTASDLERALAAQAAQRSGFLAAIARCVGRPLDEVEAEWDRGASLEAVDAVALGYADALFEATRRAGRGDG
jgi:ATP-dependent Clp protease, protease subunit